MPSRNRAPSLRSGAFTLVELLLAVALLALLLGAIAFNFSSLQQGQALEQGADQFESLLRIARAHAALSGHPVLVGLIPASPSASANTDGLALAVLAQPAPLQNPSLLTPVPGTAQLLPTLAELVQLEVEVPPNAEAEAEPDPNPKTAPAFASAPDPNPEAGLASTNTPSTAAPSIQTLITFHPDGSANPASFTLVSLDPSDTRRLRLSFDPVSASFQRQLIAVSQDPSASPDPKPRPGSETEPGTTPASEERP